MHYTARCGRIAAAGLFTVIGLALGADPAGGSQDLRQVLVTRIDDAITPVIADHLRDGVGRAERGDYAAYVVELDTPGGLDSSMRDIIQRFLDAEVPVVVYVSPRGARAASAGAFITYASNIAAMAPGTAIGAATPVGGEGGEDLDNKVINDAAALAESLARTRDRNAQFAVEMVREGRSISASEAVEIGAVDLEATSLPELLEAIDGMVVELGSGEEVTLRSAGAVEERYDLGLFRRILQFLANPTLAFLLLSIGTLGLIYELASPGVGIAGITGLVMIVLALFALSLLPVNVVGVILLLLAAALFVAEVLAPGFAGFAAGGVLALVLSGVFLFDDAPGLTLSLTVVLPVAIVVGGAVVLAGRLAWRARRAPSRTTGSGLFEGRVVTVQQASGRSGQALVEGAWWTLRSPDADLTDGMRARVVGVDGLVLVVVPEPPEPAQVKPLESKPPEEKT